MVQSCNDLVHSLELLCGWVNDVCRQRLVWLGPGKVAVFFIYHPVAVHEQLLHSGKVFRKCRWVLEIPESICSA